MDESLNVLTMVGLFVALCVAMNQWGRCREQLVAAKERINELLNKQTEANLKLGLRFGIEVVDVPEKTVTRPAHMEVRKVTRERI